MKVLLLLALISCSTMRQRTVVVSVYDYPVAMDSVIVADSVVHMRYKDELKRQENKKNFWKGTTVTLMIFLIYFIWR